MKIYGQTKAKVLSKAEPTKSRDGQSTYYKLGIQVGSECGMVSVNADIYDFVLTDNPYIFETVYDDQYKSFRFNRLLSEPPKPATK